MKFLLDVDLGPNHHLGCVVGVEGVGRLLGFENDNEGEKRAKVGKAVAPKGTMSCRTQGVGLQLNCVCEAGILVLGLEFEPLGWDLSLGVGILVLRLRFEPQGWDLNLEAGI